jgi:glycosyltransferase involved in cell wall biosynthesis
LQFPNDRFIVSMVAANKGFPCRKAFFEQIQAFANFEKRHGDALLYLHSQMGGSGNSMEVNLPEFCAAVGLEPGKNVVFANPLQLMLGYPDEAMIDIYNASDALLNVSLGEGFGIPILEAQSCGCPVIVGDWTSMGELCFSGWKVDRKDSVPTWTLMGSYQFVPQVGAIEDKLEAAYRMKGNEDYRKRARDGALAYDADKVAEKYWMPALKQIEEAVEAWA